MSRTSFSSPIACGTQDAGGPNPSNMGICTLAQVITVNRDATLVQTVPFSLPANSAVLNMMADVITPYDSATSATLTVGKTAGASDYVGGVNAKTGGRAAIAFTQAQAAALANIGTNTVLYATVTSVGQPTVGQVRVLVTYVPADN